MGIPAHDELFSTSFVGKNTHATFVKL